MSSPAKKTKPAAKPPVKRVIAKRVAIERSAASGTVTSKAPPKRALKPPSKRKDAINLRIDDATLKLIDQAAALSQQNRTDLMVRAARIEAQNILLDRTNFALDAKAWSALQTALANPPPANDALKAAFLAKPVWERE